MKLRTSSFKYIYNFYCITVLLYSHAYHNFLTYQYQHGHLYLAFVNTKMTLTQRFTEIKLSFVVVVAASHPHHIL